MKLKRYQWIVASSRHRQGLVGQTKRLQHERAMRSQYRLRWCVHLVRDHVTLLRQKESARRQAHKAARRGPAEPAQARCDAIGRFFFGSLHT